MANPKYLDQAIQLATNALMYQQFLTPRQKRRFRRFIQDCQANKQITDKQIKSILRHSIKAHHNLTHKVSGPV
jgi:hypothetical protein